MKLSEVIPQEARQTMKLSSLTTDTGQQETTVFVPETGKTIGYGGDRNYDDIRFDVETTELKKDKSAFFDTVEIMDEAAIGVFKGLGQFAIQQLPQAIIGLAEERTAEMASRELPDLFSDVMNPNPLISSKATVDLAFKSVFGKKRLIQQSEEMMRLTDRLIEKTNEIEALKTEGTAQEVGAAIGSGVASLATSLGLYALTKDATASSILFAGIGKGGATTRARLAGKSLEERQAISNLVGVGEGVLEMVGLNLWSRWVRGSGRIANTLRIGGRSVGEGLQEMGQELSQETILKLSGVSNDDWGKIWKQAAYAGAIGLVVGGSVATFVNFAENKNPVVGPLRKAGLNDAEIEQVYEAIAKQAAKKTEPELAAAVTREMMNADKTVQESKKATQTAEQTKTTTKKTVTKEGLIDLYKRVMSGLTAKRVAGAKSDDAGRIGKADGMKQSSIIRKMKGEPTGIELRNALNRLNSNYIGKTVQTPKGEGVIVSAPAFGKFKVKYADGTEVFVAGESIKSDQATKEKAIEALRAEAVKEARQQLEVFGGIKQADQPTELETTTTEVAEQAQEAPKTPETAPKVEEAGKAPSEGKRTQKTTIPKAVSKPIMTKGGKEVKSKAFAKMLDRVKGDAQKQQNLLDVLDMMEQIEGESALYTQMNIADQVALGFQFVEENPASAKRIAQGLEAPPAGVTQTAISLAYSSKMKEEGNMQAYLDAEKTRMLQQRRRGQEIVMERGRVDDHSAEHFISQVIDARMAMAGKKMFAKPTGKEVETRIQKGQERVRQEADALSKQLSRQQLDMAAAQKIIDGIIC